MEIPNSLATAPAKPKIVRSQCKHCKQYGIAEYGEGGKLLRIDPIEHLDDCKLITDAIGEQTHITGQGLSEICD